MSVLEQWLLEQSHTDRDLYMMLDSDAQPDERRALASELGAEQFRNLYVGTLANSMASSGPFLLRIGAVRHPTVQALLDMPERHWGWLASAASIDLDAIADHWRVRLVTHEHPTQAVYRFHDNRVLARALAYLQPEQRPAYLGPIASVCYWNAGQWITTDNPDPGAHPLPAEPAWLKTPTPAIIHANVLFDNTRRYLVSKHTDALVSLAAQRDVDDWLWSVIELVHAWNWQQPEQVHFLLTQCLKAQDYRPPKSWEPAAGEEPAAHFERVYQQVLYWQGGSTPARYEFIRLVFS